MLEAIFSSLRKQDQTEDYSTLALQYHSLAFLSRLLQIAPIALQTLRGSGIWDKLYGHSMFFYGAGTALRPSIDSEAAAQDLQLTSEASHRASEESEDKVRVHCKVDEQSRTVKVRMDLFYGRDHDAGELTHFLN